VIYLDTSALVKLVFTETESDGLARWLTERQQVPKLPAKFDRRSDPSLPPS
jgi:predicted nucleic acid-binding protein